MAEVSGSGAMAGPVGAPGALPSSPAAVSAPAGGWEARLLAEGAIWNGHFRLSSGLHAARYVQCQRAMGDPRIAAELGAALAEPFRSLGIEAVCGPALGAIVLAHEVARALCARSLFAERTSDGAGFLLRRGQTVARGARVLVCENVVTTGRSARRVLRMLDRLEARPVGVATLVDRSPAGSEPFGDLLFRSLCRVEIPAFAPESCPQCATGDPLVAPGSSRASST